MEYSAHDLLSAWESFYVIVGSSAAALTGLQFVVMALVADNPDFGTADSVAAFGTPTVVHFSLCLFISALLSAPWHRTAHVGWLLLAAGIVGVVYTLVVIRRARRQTGYPPVMEDWVWHAILPMITYVTLVGAAIGVFRAPREALFLVAAVTLVLIYIGIHNSWDTVAYIAVQQRAKPEE